MEIRRSFPHPVRVLEHVWIPLRDGCRLAARIWLPEGADGAPVPALVEMIPYRKRVGTRLRDETMHRWYAGHGYAAVRIDIRGSGESDGLLLDEYLPQEQDDGVEAIAWVANQPWCDGAVGLIGKSWGGFAALQVAARRPPALKAVVAVCATDDRYGDDAHVMGGCLLNENLIWGSVFLTVAAQPPDPALFGPGWSEAWRTRLENLPLFTETWLRHPLRDDYWRHGSVGETPERIDVPVYAVSGWADGYTNAVPRLLERLRVPRRGLIGPWAHVYPHEGVPGPAIGFLQDTLGWWDRWLRGRPGAPDDAPRLRAWMQLPSPPGAWPAERPGRWVAEPAWPSPRIRPVRWTLAGDQLLAPGPPAPPGPPRAWRSPQTVGLAAGAWCGFGVEGEAPGDQRPDDEASLCYTSPALDTPFEVLGVPAVRLRLAVDRPTAFVCVRLVDVGPDGVCERVSFGLRNLAHDDAHERIVPARPGEVREVEVRLNACGHRFEAGHRLRLALSTTYWPMVWPSPEPVTLTVHPAGSALDLPVRPPRPEDAALPDYAPPEGAPPPDTRDLDPFRTRRHVRHDLCAGLTTWVVETDVAEDGGVAMTRFEDIDLESGHAILERFSIADDDPSSAVAEVEHRTVLRRAGWSVRVETRSRLTGDRETLRLEAEIAAYEGGRPVLRRAWDRRIPRTGR